MLADNNWRITTAVAVAMMSETGKALRQPPVPVPEEAEKLNGIVREMGGDLTYIAEEYTAGIDQLSTVRLGNATNRMQAITPKTQAAIAEVRRLSGQ